MAESIFSCSCGWHGDKPEQQKLPHPGGWAYWTCLCPNCGRYFSEEQINIANASPARTDSEKAK